MKPSVDNSSSEAGQAVILVVVAMSILLFGALGLAIDGSQIYAQRQMAQAAADAAVQAGMMSILDGTNSTSANPFGTGTPPIASSVCTTADLRTPCVYARYNGFGGTAADTVTLSFPASVSGVTFTVRHRSCVRGDGATNLANGTDAVFRGGDLHRHRQKHRRDNIYGIEYLRVRALAKRYLVFRRRLWSH